METKRSTILILLLCATEAFILGCKKPAPPPPPPANVTVSSPFTEEVVEWHEFSGRLESPKVVSLAARVSGIIEEAPFTEGAMVTAGDTLFVIDSRPFKAELASKSADLARAQAQLAQAQVHYNRYSKIKGTRAISDEDFDQAVASLRQAEAAERSAKAAEDVAKLNLEWTTVTSPISGKASRKLVTEGNLVNGGAGQATQLTTITSIDPLYCYVNVPERSYQIYRSLSSGASSETERPPCDIQLEGEKAWTNHGHIDFVDNQIDRTTGTVQLRCVISNASGNLASGLFARMRIPGSKPYATTLVPDATVGTDQNSRFILTVNKEDTVEMKRVKIGELFGTFRAITEGIGLEDRIIVNGASLVRPGAKVVVSSTPIAPESVQALRASHSPTTLRPVLAASILVATPNPAPSLVKTHPKGSTKK